MFVAYVTSIPFWTDPVAGFMAACEALGVKGTFTGPVEFDAAAQARTVEELIAKKPAGIVIFPADPDALSEPLKKAMEAGIPVICANSDVKDLSARYGYVGINNLEGRQARWQDRDRPPDQEERRAQGHRRHHDHARRDGARRPQERLPRPR